MHRLYPLFLYFTSSVLLLYLCCAATCRPKPYGNYGSCMVSLSNALLCLGNYLEQHDGKLPGSLTEREFIAVSEDLGFKPEHFRLIMYFPPASKIDMLPTNTIICVCQRPTDRKLAWAATVDGSVYNAPVNELREGGNISVGHRRAARFTDLQSSGFQKR